MDDIAFLELDRTSVGLIGSVGGVTNKVFLSLEHEVERASVKVAISKVINIWRKFIMWSGLLNLFFCFTKQKSPAGKAGLFCLV